MSVSLEKVNQMICKVIEVKKKGRITMKLFFFLNKKKLNFGESSNLSSHKIQFQTFIRIIFNQYR